jgi:hypothetical protein
MRVNDDLRIALKDSKIRRQDAAMVLHIDYKRITAANSELNSAPDLKAKVKAMFSECRPIPDRAVSGIISAATGFSTEVLQSMVQSPINMPVWIFQTLVPALLRLSSEYT